MSEADHHTLVASRKTRFTALAELLQPVEALTRAIEAEDPRFKLFGYSPVYDLYPLHDGDQSNVDKWVMTCTIQWNFGREPHDPTHELIFFAGNHERWAAMLKIEFVLVADESTFPGLVAKLSITPSALTDRPADTTPRLARLLAAMKQAFAADHTHIDPPGQSRTL